jgi:type II secretory pathway pseudopilin PulG
MAIFTWNKKEVKDGDGEKQEFTLPDELVTQIKAGSEAAGKLGTIEEKLKGLDSIQQYVEDQKKEKEELKKKQQQQQRQEQQGTIEEQIEALMLEGKTSEAIALATSGQTLAIKATHAELVRREVFEDQEKFPYYHGDIKREVDSLIASQAVDFRTNPQNIENCYNTILGKHTKDIVEGKLKTRFAQSTSTTRSKSGTGDALDDKGKRQRNWDDDTEKGIREAARHSGLKYEDYVDLLDKEGVI